MTTQPTVHTIADALHIIADLVPRGRVFNGQVACDPWQAEQIVAAMTDVLHWPKRRPEQWSGRLLGAYLTVVAAFPVLDRALVADAFDQEAGR